MAVLQVPNTVVLIFTLLSAVTVLISPNAANPLLLTKTHAARCPLGSIRDPSKNTCLLCPRGHFHRAFYFDKCTPCPKNTFNPFKGAVDKSACRPCGPSAVSTPGATTCTTCAKGYVAVNAAACVRCPPGTSLPIRGTRCRKCAPGFISSLPNVLQCSPCPKGSMSNAARTECVTTRRCPSGQEWSISTCFPCPPNHYRSFTMPTCAPCPLRTVPNDRASACVLCPPNTFITNLFSEAYVRSCQPCPSNLTTLGYSKPICAVPVNQSGTVPCPKYTFRDSDKDCDRCARDEYLKTLNSGVRVCAPCPKGTYSSGGFSKSCSQCAKDQVVLSPASVKAIGDSRHISRCGCPDGTVVSDEFDKVFNKTLFAMSSVCEKCPAGTFKTVGERRCTPCGADEFSLSGASSCSKCPPRTYSSPTNGSACVPVPKCPTGYDVRDVRDGCVSGATGCPLGSKFELQEDGRTRKDGLCIKENGDLACTGGTVFNGVDQCIRCGLGFFLSERETTGGNSSKSTELVCSQCPFGSFSVMENSYECSKCPAGFVGTGDRCLCDVGYYIDQAKLSCRQCNQPFPFYLHYDCALSTFLSLWIISRRLAYILYIFHI